MTARTGIDACAWTIGELGEAVEILCRRISSLRSDSPPAFFHTTTVEPHAFGGALDRVVAPFDLEAEPVAVTYAGVALIGGPAIVRLPAPGDEPDARFAVVWRSTRSTVTLLDRERRWRGVPRAQLAGVLRAATDAEASGDVERLLSSAGLDPRREPAIRRALLADRAADRHVADAWILRAEPGSPFVGRLRDEGVRRDAVALVAIHGVQFALWILAWSLIGRIALDGRIDSGWLTAWVLVLATMVPLQAVAGWVQGTLALRVGRLLKERFLIGALRLDPEAVRTEGAGQLLGRVIESEAVEAQAIAGGLQAGLAAVEIVMSAAVLAAGASPAVHIPLLGVVVAAVAAVAWRYHSRRRRWTEWRLNMTHALVERVAGHRTRLAQEAPERWHLDEDRALEEYVDRSTTIDRLLPVLSVALPRAWTMVALVALVPGVVAGARAPLLAVSVGGVLLVSLALRRFADGLSEISSAVIAWRQARPLFDSAARRPSLPAISEADGRSGTRGAGGPVLDARNVTFRYPTRREPVLRSCALRIENGDRILLQGPSGGGKSTLASIVAGLRAPDSGLVLLGGLDRRTLGEQAWRRRVVLAPQFHENHVFTETFSFNLLMGRPWPPTDDDLRAGEEIVAELGLSGLVERMPAGLLQLVGEGGWQLSHGERSRLFMARALLQGGDVMVLDESFAALDPANLRDTLECALRRAPALVVVAHP